MLSKEKWSRSLKDAEAAAQAFKKRIAPKGAVKNATFRLPPDVPKLLAQEFITSQNNQ